MVLKREMEQERVKTQELLEKVLKLNREIQHTKGKVKVLVKGESLQFYMKTCKEDGVDGRYLHADEKEKAISIVKAEYYNKLINALEERIRNINRLMLCIDRTDPFKIYLSMGKGKQRIVESLVTSNKEYREEWLSEEYQGKEFREDTSEIYTDRGERVRSKSEKIIADKLYNENIPYRYEYPLDIPYFGIIYPDFTILDEEKRRNIIYEHFGLMDDENYVNKAISKIQLYASAGYILGDNLFITMETSVKPFDSRILDGIIGVIKK